jgi:hypothetical protein
MDNFVYYIGRIVTGVLSADPSVIVEVVRPDTIEGFQIKVRKKIPLTDKVATYHMTLADLHIAQVSQIYIDGIVQADIRKILFDLEAVIHNPRKDQ